MEEKQFLHCISSDILSGSLEDQTLIRNAIYHSAKQPIAWISFQQLKASDIVIIAITKQ